MRKQSPFIDVVVKRFARARQRLTPPSPKLPLRSYHGEADRALPAFRSADFSPPQRPSNHGKTKAVRARIEVAWPQEDCANEPSPLHCFGEHRALWALGAKVALVLLCLAISLASRAATREVGAIGLTVGNLDRELDFFTKVLPFKKISESKSVPGEADALLGLTNTQFRIAELKLNNEQITLTEHLANRGRPIPLDSRSFDHWFQHIAIVVSDMDKAYDHLRHAKVKHVSTAPQTLPSWNKDAGGIKAFYFRDPEDHVLEIIWFPPGKGDPKWQRPTDKLFLGIDHTAIVVSDTDQSRAFYRDLLGMRVVGHAENYGTEQEHLNQVFGARLRITALRGGRGPGIEFLEYITPPGGRSLPKDSNANDLLFWTTQLFTDDAAALAQKLRENGTRFVSRQDSPTQIARDPDGHALRIEGIPEAVGTISLRR